MIPFASDQAARLHPGADLPPYTGVDFSAENEPLPRLRSERSQFARTQTSPVCVPLCLPARWRPFAQNAASRCAVLGQRARKIGLVGG
jgi:hypothetical protein